MDYRLNAPARTLPYTVVAGSRKSCVAAAVLWNERREPVALRRREL